MKLASRPPERESDKTNSGPFSFLKKSNEKTKALPLIPQPPAKKKTSLISLMNQKSPDSALADNKFSPDKLAGSSKTSAAWVPAMGLPLFLSACAVAAVVLPSGAGNYFASVAVLAGVVAFHEAGHLVAALSQVPMEHFLVAALSQVPIVHPLVAALSQVPMEHPLVAALSQVALHRATKVTFD
jgi:hypothetical protein